MCAFYSGMCARERQCRVCLVSEEVGQCAEDQRVVFTSDSHGGNAQYLTNAHSPLKGHKIMVLLRH